MGHIANDSASNNAAAAAQIEKRLVRRGVGENWHAKERDLAYIFCYTYQMGPDLAHTHFAQVLLTCHPSRHRRFHGWRDTGRSRRVKTGDLGVRPPGDGKPRSWWS